MNISPSDRLTYRLMDCNDADLLFELDQDPEVMKYLTGGKVSTRDDIENTMIPRLEKYRNPDKGFGLWQVNVSESNEYIGWILVRPMHFFSDHPEFDNIELGWRFKRSSWGKGYATEAASQVLKSLSKDLSIKKFSAIALTKNSASIQIMKKLGMSYVKSDIHEVPILGKVELDFYEVTNC